MNTNGARRAGLITISMPTRRRQLRHVTRYSEGGGYAPCSYAATQLAIAVAAKSRADMLLNKVIKSLTVVCLRCRAGVDIK